MQETLDLESSGYSTSASASSDYGSLDDHFKFPKVNVVKTVHKRRAEENVEQLDELMKETLKLSPPKRARLYGTSSLTSPTPREQEMEARKNGRPPTRRSTSSDCELSPRVISLRASASSSIVNSDSISPKFLKQFTSPKKRINLSENVYSKHRLGATFSPLVVGAKRKLGTPSQHPANRESPVDSPRTSGLRRSGIVRMKRPLNLRFDTLDD